MSPGSCLRSCVPGCSWFGFRELCLISWVEGAVCCGCLRLFDEALSLWSAVTRDRIELCMSLLLQQWQRYVAGGRGGGGPGDNK